MVGSDHDTVWPGTEAVREDHYDGRCFGGPWDGRDVTCRRKRFAVYERMSPVLLRPLANEIPQADYKFGEYLYNGHGQFHWWPAE